MRLEPSGEAFRLCYPEWVDEVAKMIVGGADSFTYGLYGRWGAGKSSAALALAESMQPLASMRNMRLDVILINAFLARTSEDAVTEGLKQIDRLKKSGNPKADAILDVFYAVSSSQAAKAFIGLAPGGGTASVAIEFLGGAGKTLAAKRPKAAPMLRQDVNTDRTVVIVDDLDRCEPNVAIRALAKFVETLSSSRVSLVVACDPEVLAAHAAHSFGVSRAIGLQALSKYIQVPLKLPTGVTPQHLSALEARIPLSLPPEQQIWLANSAIRVLGVVPIRDVLAALPQAGLWIQLSLRAKCEMDARVANKLLFLSLLSSNLPELINAATRTTSPLSGLSKLFMHSLSQAKNTEAMKEVLRQFGDDVVDTIRLRADLFRAYQLLVEPAFTDAEGRWIASILGTGVKV